MSEEFKMLRKLKYALIDHYEDTGKRQWEVAGQIGKAANWISGVIKERVKPSKFEKKELSKILGKPIDELFPEPETTEHQIDKDRLVMEDVN